MYGKPSKMTLDILIDALIYIILHLNVHTKYSNFLTQYPGVQIFNSDSIQKDIDLQRTRIISIL